MGFEGQPRDIAKNILASAVSDPRPKAFVSSARKEASENISFYDEHVACDACSKGSY